MTHRCSPCNSVFSSEAEYLAHKCEKAGGAMPGTPEFLKATTMPNFDIVSKAAQERGEAKKTK